ncbi:MAG: glycosyltransferase [Gemmatimonadales bacterium]|nr:glycosyltransferase [Gemmatimonadales bacterium]
MVIPTFGRRASVLRLLQALGRQAGPPADFEVIVSIDGSQDGTQEVVGSFPAPFLLRSLWQPNRGRAAACNAGLRAAVGELVVFLDDDMEPAPGFLEGHKRAHSAAPPPRGVVGAAPIIVGDSAPPLVSYVGHAFNARLERLARAERVHFKDAYTGNFSAPRAVLERIGGYDEGFRLYGHEDYELLLRLVEAGVELVYCPEALAHQHYEKTLPAVARDAIARGRTAVYFARKHHEVVDQLRLGAYAQETRKWRLLRSALLGLGRVFHGLPIAVIALMTRLERQRPPRLDRYYAMALDYFYWVGVQAVVREKKKEGL